MLSLTMTHNPGKTQSSRDKGSAWNFNPDHTAPSLYLYPSHKSETRIKWFKALWPCGIEIVVSANFLVGDNS